MANYRHLLLAVDFSEASHYIARKAKTFADAHDAQLSLVHVLDNIPMPDTHYGTVIPLDRISEYDLLESEKRKLLELGRTLQIEQNDCWLIWGVPKQEIVNLAAKLTADLIVVGSHGRHGLALLLGSTANAVLHHASCDVLAIRLS